LRPLASTHSRIVQLGFFKNQESWFYNTHTWCKGVDCRHNAQVSRFASNWNFSESKEKVLQTPEKLELENMFQLNFSNLKSHKRKNEKITEEDNFIETVIRHITHGCILRGPPIDTTTPRESTEPTKHCINHSHPLLPEKKSLPSVQCFAECFFRALSVFAECCFRHSVKTSLPSAFFTHSAKKLFAECLF
jgi:hypothetical protein